MHKWECVWGWAVRGSWMILISGETLLSLEYYFGVLQYYFGVLQSSKFPVVRTGFAPY